MKKLNQKIKNFRNRYRRKCSIVFLGLNYAGKTSICCTLAGKPDKQVVPTVGMGKPRILQVNKYDVSLYDLGGASSFRKIWRTKLLIGHAAVYVVDASCRERIVEARDELATYLGDESFVGKPFVIFANKVDLPDTMGREELFDLLDLNNSRFAQSEFQLITCTASKKLNNDVVDSSLLEGITWLTDKIDNKWTPLKNRVARDMMQQKIQNDKKKKEAAKQAAELRRKRQEAADRGEKFTTKKSAVAPSEPTVFICKNFLLKGNLRVPCENEAKHRNSVTGWRNFCDNCYELAMSKKEGGEKMQSQVQEDVAPVGKEQSLKNQAIGRSCEILHQEWLSGIIQGINEDGTFRVRYSDGRIRENVVKGHLRNIAIAQAQAQAQTPAPGKAGNNLKINTSPTSTRLIYSSPEVNPCTFIEKGTEVEANFKGIGKWYKATVQQVNGNSTYDLSYETGESEKAVPMSMIIPTEGPIIPEGSRVSVRFHGKDVFYTGVIRGYDSAMKTYTIHYDDGDRDNSVKRGWIKVLSQKGFSPTHSPTMVPTSSPVSIKPVSFNPSSQPTMQPSTNSTNHSHQVDILKYEILEPGAEVDVNFKGKNKWFSGKITTKNNNETFDIEYDEGGKETQVSRCNIIPVYGPIIPVQTKVSVRYRGKGNFFTGKIKSYAPDKSLYAVDFDDGDHDANVKRRWIKINVEKLSSNQESSSDMKTSSSSAHKAPQVSMKRSQSGEKLKPIGKPLVPLSNVELTQPISSQKVLPPLKGVL